jgi:hypothetical protein
MRKTLLLTLLTTIGAFALTVKCEEITFKDVKEDTNYYYFKIYNKQGVQIGVIRELKKACYDNSDTTKEDDPITKKKDSSSFLDILLGS